MVGPRLNKRAGSNPVASLLDIVESPRSLRHNSLVFTVGCAHPNSSNVSPLPYMPTVHYYHRQKCGLSNVGLARPNAVRSLS